MNEVFDTSSPDPSREREASLRAIEGITKTSAAW